MVPPSIGSQLADLIDDLLSDEVTDSEVWARWPHAESESADLSHLRRLLTRYIVSRNDPHQGAYWGYWPTPDPRYVLLRRLVAAQAQKLRMHLLVTGSTSRQPHADE